MSKRAEVSSVLSTQRNTGLPRRSAKREGGCRPCRPIVNSGSRAGLRSFKGFGGSSPGDSSVLSTVCRLQPSAFSFGGFGDTTNIECAQRTLDLGLWTAGDCHSRFQDSNVTIPPKQL